MTSKWPMWIDIFYYEKASGLIRRYVGCMNNAVMILESIHRLELREENIVQWMAHDKLLRTDEISQLFRLYEKHRKEIESKYEKR